MKIKYRIKKKSEIDLLFREKLKAGNSYFTIYLKRSKENVNFRFAMSIGRKYGNAVYRNKIKRQIRSIIRLNMLNIDSTANFIIVIKPKANELEYQKIETLIKELLKKLKIMENINEKH